MLICQRKIFVTIEWIIKRSSVRFIIYPVCKYRGVAFNKAVNKEVNELIFH